jgi:hypothetical protein
VEPPNEFPLSVVTTDLFAEVRYLLGQTAVGP